MSETPTVPENDYFLALGKFVHRYAEIEGILHQVLRVASGLSRNSAYVVFSGTRVKGATDIINRFYEARSEAVPEPLARAIARLGEITKMRDDVLHYGLDIAADGAKLSTKWRNLPTRTWTMTVSVQDLHDLEVDCCTIKACLVSYWIETRVQKHKYRKGWADLALEAWRYKPPPRAKTPDKKAKAPRKR